MKSNKELILQILKENSFNPVLGNAKTKIIDEADFNSVAHQILLVLQVQDEPQLQLQQTPCSTALELLEQEYNKLANVDPTTMSSHENWIRVLRKGKVFQCMKLIRELSANAV